MKLMNCHRGGSVLHARQSEKGQTTMLVVVMLSLFLIGFLGFAVDYSNLWFHRQTAQGAADAVCQAGAMDMLLLAQSTPTGVNGFNPGFTPGTSFTCTRGSTIPVCQYAALNGYPGVSMGAGGPANPVSVSFPSSVPGVTPPPTALTTNPFIRVDILDKAPVFFSSLISGSRTQEVRAFSVCGLLKTKGPIPIIVLHPSMAGSFSIQGQTTVTITGGPRKSIQVNSNDPAAGYVGGNAYLDLSLGGPANPPTGSDFGVQGGPATPPCISPCKNWNDGSTGHWVSPSAPASDPFADLPVPTAPGPGATQIVCAQASLCPGAAATDAGCPAVPPNTCTQYSPGSYAGITIKNDNAVFVPGEYYLTGDLVLDTNSVVRPSTATGNGSQGTMFYFSGTAGIDVKGASGGGRGTITSFDTSVVQCTGGAAPNPPLPATLNGNIFLGPCTGTYGDPLGQYRGMVFFHDRSTVPTNLDMHGNGGLLVGGNMYFHQNTSYGTVFGLYGNTGSSTQVLGSIVVDQLLLSGGGTINMQLNPQAGYSTLKAQLLR